MSDDKVLVDCDDESCPEYQAYMINANPRPKVCQDCGGRKKNTVASKGNCKCIYEPRGRYGLEGYQLGEIYPYEKMAMDTNGKPYYRVYPPDPDDPDYYETCGVTGFKKCFEIVYPDVPIYEDAGLKVIFFDLDAYIDYAIHTIRKWIVDDDPKQKVDMTLSVQKLKPKPTKELLDLLAKVPHNQPTVSVWKVKKGNDDKGRTYYALNREEVDIDTTKWTNIRIQEYTLFRHIPTTSKCPTCYGTGLDPAKRLKPPCKHQFAWSGEIPNTGMYRCVFCGDPQDPHTFNGKAETCSICGGSNTTTSPDGDAVYCRDCKDVL